MPWAFCFALNRDSKQAVFQPSTPVHKGKSICHAEEKSAKKYLQIPMPNQPITAGVVHSDLAIVGAFFRPIISGMVALSAGVLRLQGWWRNCMHQCAVVKWSWWMFWCKAPSASVDHVLVTLVNAVMSEFKACNRASRRQ
ncbi:uncharacterized protein CIMG_13380 [Coccidioides immitis RS]|uniref:Uncharacterized protein n=1 Tax=Coccidioides immitis (strain RS) TaxID=246410 RepID=A0A0D8JUJ1_COCIM|nr:uncharacterized protein CIMG_13380 [Coccidioides immitis RS]KJF61020.1 hypothetical protein CIMG_13380 [Coccidioides immitis RS]